MLIQEHGRYRTPKPKANVQMEYECVLDESREDLVLLLFLEAAPGPLQNLELVFTISVEAEEGGGSEGGSVRRTLRCCPSSHSKGG